MLLCGTNDRSWLVIMTTHTLMRSYTCMYAATIDMGGGGDTRNTTAKE